MLAHEAITFAFRLQILFTIALTAYLPAHVVPPVSTISLPEQLNLTFPVNLSLFRPSQKCVSSLSFPPHPNPTPLVDQTTQHSPYCE